MIKELFEGPVGDYCIARNTIKCLLYMKQCIILSVVKPFKCCLQTTCAVHAGASGGGVFNTQGQLVAMVICNSRSCSYISFVS